MISSPSCAILSNNRIPGVLQFLSWTLNVPGGLMWGRVIASENSLDNLLHVQLGTPSQNRRSRTYYSLKIQVEQLHKCILGCTKLICPRRPT